MINRFGLLVVLLWTGLGIAQPELRYRANLVMSQEAIDLKGPIEVDFEIEGATEASCLYVPAHDQRLRDILLLESLKAPSPQDNAGRQELGIEWIDSHNLEHIGPALYRIAHLPGKTLKLKYLLTMGGWSDRSEAPRLLTLWHPILLKSCPSAEDQTFASIWPKGHFEVTISQPGEWQLAAPGLQREKTWIYDGSTFSAVFFKHAELAVHTIGEQTLISVSKSKGFSQLINFAKIALAKFAKITGKIEEPTILLVETDDYEPVRTPGLVTLNTPQQPAMRYLQQDVTHWNVWQLSLQIAQQWYGLGCRAATVDDHWLVQGLADILLSSLLTGETDYFELFGRDAGGKPYFNLNYRQAQDLAAASLSLLHPQTSLLNSEGISHPASADRPFISYIRNTQVLRYLQWKLGDKPFQSFLQDASHQCGEESLQPSDVLKLADKYEPGISTLMLKYWQSDDWPDVSLNGTFTRDGKSYARVHYENDLLLPVDLWVTTKSGEHHMVFIDPLAQDVEVPLVDPEREISKIELNPGRAMYDKDRFNNKTGAPKIAFFPGAARGLEDDAYTILWLPFATQLPGEPFTIDLAWQTLRYLNSGLTGLLRYTPQINRAGFNVIYVKAFPESSLFYMLKIGQDDGHVEVGERRIDLSVKRNPLWSLFPRLVGSTRIRSEQMMGQPSANHFTAGASLGSHGESGKACFHDEEADTESTIYVPSKDFNYTRSYARLSAGCESRKVGARFRLFYGASRVDGIVPATALFRAQNLDEAHVRLDKPHLIGALRVAAFNLETSFPAALPLPESWFVLPRRSQFKIFLDGAQMMDPNTDITVSGVGYSLPIGGDIAGKDTVTVFRFSLNGIFYRRIDSKEDTKPGVLFDFSGSL
ncbi:MAG: hypothetical protein H7249_14350 [Chitinophagaceae bacterium]|nr:hypothetical protein [Oligoflexus sp.]